MISKTQKKRKGGTQLWSFTMHITCTAKIDKRKDRRAITIQVQENIFKKEVDYR